MPAVGHCLTGLRMGPPTSSAPHEQCGFPQPAHASKDNDALFASFLQCCKAIILGKYVIISCSSESTSGCSATIVGESGNVIVSWDLLLPCQHALRPFFTHKH